MITIKEIAEEAGVSIGTVDRVLHKRGRVALETERKIRQIIKESGYSQNLFASNLAKSRKTYNFAVLVPRLGQDSAYWSLVRSAIDSAAAELKSFNIHITLTEFDRFDEDDFRRAYAEVASGNHDGVFMAPVISGTAEECLKENPLRVPFAFFDSDIPDSGRLFFIGQDSLQGGRIGGKLIHLLAGDSGDVAVTRMMPEGYHINDRVKGFRDYFKNIPGIRIHEIRIDYTDFRKNITAACREIKEKLPDIKGLFVTNANSHYFVENIREIMPDRHINIVGFDLVEENRKCLISGEIDFLISQNPENQASKGLELLSKALLLKKHTVDRYMLPLDIITKENLQPDQLP